MKVRDRKLPRNGHLALMTIKGMLSAFMGFIEDGDEVIIFEPFFDQ
jgi:kynurenine aminotransferase